jgi:DUF4097 and DUF4098 domain-containing protein YvlB
LKLGRPTLRTGFVAVFLLTALGLVAGQPGPHREGDFWVETTTGSLTVGDGEQLKITLIGDVIVRGVGGHQVEYKLTRRVRTNSLAEAKEALEDSEVTLVRHAHYSRLAVDGETGPVTLEVTVPKSLSGLIVGTDSGTLDVGDFDGSVLAQTGAGDARLSHIKGSVDVSTAGGTVRLGDVGSSAKVNTAAGDITAESIGGEARLETGGGDITVQKAGANIRAVTGGGKVRLGQVAGSVIASNGGGGAIDIGRAGGTVNAHNSGGGPIFIGSAGGIQCESASGAIKVGSSGLMHVVTASGSVVVQFQGDKLLNNSYVSTGWGDITVFLPSNIKVTVQAQNSGSNSSKGIVSDFPDLRVAVSGGTVNARGELNGGGPLLRIQATSGTIWIKKK